MTKGLVAVALLLALFGGVYCHYRIADRAGLTDVQATAALHFLRARFDGRPATPPAGPTVKLWVSRYQDGQVADRTGAYGPLSIVLQQLSLKPGPGRLKLDVELGRAPFPPFALAQVFAVMAGHDGLSAHDASGREAILLPDDLLSDNLLRGHHPLSGVELDLGLDVPATLARLHDQLGSDGPVKIERVRTQGFVESADLTRALPVVAGVARTTHGTATADELLHGATAAGDYLLRHLQPDGSFDYEYDVADPSLHPGGYSLPRHAGAVYFLARLYGQAPTPVLRDAVPRALYFLMAQARPGGPCDRPDRACVGDDESGDLGASALALVATAEYQRTTGDRSFAAWSTRLARFLVAMQKSDGDFCHLYDVAHDRRDESTRLLYYSGEATLALGRWAHLADATDAALYLDAARRGMRYLTVTQYQPLIASFLYGEDHWTCQAAETLFADVDAPTSAAWAAFCDGFAGFVGRTQLRAGDVTVTAHPDFAGSYGFGPLLPPHTTPVGSRSESALSTIAMEDAMALRDPRQAEKWRQRATALRAAVRTGMIFLLDRQLDEDRAYLAAEPPAVVGGLLMSDVERTIRIDTLQHCGSAMLSAHTALQLPN